MSFTAPTRSLPAVVDGAIWDVVAGPDGRATEIKLERCPAGWQVSFQLQHPDVADLAVIHRLVAPTRREAKAAVPNAISFLLGNPLETAR